MKIFASSLLLFLPMMVVAQSLQGMNQQDMQKMMEQMQRMQSCMQDIDQSELKNIEQRSHQISVEIKALCENGQRNQAQEKAISFSQEVMSMPAMQAMKKCGEMMQGIAKGIVPQTAFIEQDYSSRHVCDEV
jgi:hypothetical protein